MPLSELLIDDRVTVLANPHDRDAVLDAAAGLLAGPADTATLAAVRTSLGQREALGSTAIGHGVAIPHGRSELWDQARAAFLRLQHPVDFGASDGQPVDLVIAMTVPEHSREQHLLALAEIAERFGDATFRDRLRATASLEELRAMMRPGKKRSSSTP